MWSPRRVGVSVTNSRSARNERSAKSTVAPITPVATAAPKTATISHQARMRAFRFAIVARPASVEVRFASTKPISDAITRSVPTPPSRYAVSLDSENARLIPDAPVLREAARGSLPSFHPSRAEAAARA